MKKFLKLLMLTISILIVSVPVFASDTMFISELYDSSYENQITSNRILVQLNGEYVDFTDANGNKVEPQIINDRTMVPMRKIFEVLGADVEWIPETRSIKSNANGLEIGLQIDNNVATIKNSSGEAKEITLDAAPTIINDRTLVPVRFIAESLDKKVGWDNYNRAVIIIDTSFAEKMLKEDASNLYEYLTTDFVKINTYEMDMDLNGSVKYVDKEISSNNTTLNMAGDLDFKLSEEAFALDFNLDFTGKGTLIEELKAENLEELEMNCIVDIKNNVMFVKMSNLEEYADKWIKTELGEEGKIISELLEMIKTQNSAGVDTLIDTLVPENSLTISSYVELQTAMKLLTNIMGNDNFKVSGRTTKTYTFNLDLSDTIKMIMEQTGEELSAEDSIDFEIGFEVKVMDNVAKESKVMLMIEVEEAEESAKIEIELSGIVNSFNEKVSVSMPKLADVVDPYAK